MVILWLETNKARQVSIKLIASLAPARAEVEAGVVAKADQNKRRKENVNRVIYKNTSKYTSTISG